MKHKSELFELVQGLGKLTIQFDNKQPLPYYSITIHNADAKIEHFGTKALEYGRAFFEDEIVQGHKIVSIEYLMKVAEDATGGIVYDKTRKEANKLARYFVAWYSVRVIKTSTTRAGELIHRDHATVLHGLKTVEKPDKYKTQYEIDSFNEFKKLVKLYT